MEIDAVSQIQAERLVTPKTSTTLHSGIAVTSIDESEQCLVAEALSTLRARIGELEAENARLKGDAEKWRKYQSALKAALSSEREG